MTDNIHADNNPQEDELSEAEISEFLEKSTLPSEIDICVDGSYDSDDHARQVANATLAFFQMLGVFLNLSLRLMMDSGTVSLWPSPFSATVS